MKTQLLCTFAHRTDLDLIVDYIGKLYDVYEHRIFVFADMEQPRDLYLTYNVNPTDDYRKTPNTISIHRKKETNTLYTVNSLNTIIREANNGLLDKKFPIDWRLYENTLLLTSDDVLRRIELLLVRRIDL